MYNIWHFDVYTCSSLDSWYIGSTGYQSVACPPVSLQDAAHTVTLEIGLANISQSGKSKTIMRAMEMRR